MRTHGSLKRVPTVLTMLMGLIACASAQEAKLVLNPPLGEIFPLDQKPDGIRLQFPVLLNERTILRPNALLRFIYVDPNVSLHPRGGAGDGGGGPGGHGHHHGDSSGDAGDGSSAESHGPAGDGGEAQDVVSLFKGHGNEKELSAEVWTQADLFREALNDAPDTGTTLVYSYPDKPKPQTAALDLPDGMFLAEIDNHVRVLGLAEDSRAYQSGLQPDDEIRSFQGHLAVNSLTDFLRVYFAVKAEAQKNGKSYTIDVWRPKESRSLSIEVAKPPSLPSMF